ncbi:MAG: monofunctional biosynthetic peptidoglycan transglycosylase [Flavobacteriaceae bacterium]|jgi:monofunctional biosynthetic peptidoglycan transglycosylase|nr:monofunctional biosynthetic peptidoglycan transglycosylase [Flavobacteriaceae bacterium]
MKTVSKWFKRMILAFFISSVGMVVVYKFVPVPTTYLMISRYFATGKMEKTWTPIDKISKSMQLAVISGEDQNFLSHHGFDFDQIQKAMEEQQDGRRVRGASTISQQTAKNVFLWGGKNFIRKGLEAYFTVLIELIWSKQRIVEIYLNVAEFGDGIYGAEAAAHHYFGKSAAGLTRAESATLAALLPNPRKYGQNINGKYVQKRKSWIMRQMQNLSGTLVYP